jgi:uncharacterized spore protein YtfJ
MSETQDSSLQVTPGPTRAEEVLSRLGGKFASSANSKSVYGDPIYVGDRIIVPVAKVGYWLGATSGGETDGTIGGGSGGGRLTARPVGYIELFNGETRFVEYLAMKKLLTTIGLAAFAGYLLCRLTSRN